MSRVHRPRTGRGRDQTFTGPVAVLAETILGRRPHSINVKLGVSAEVLEPRGC